MLTETLVNLNTLFIHPKLVCTISFYPSPKTQLKNYLSYKLGVVSHACDPSTGKLKARESEVQGHPPYIVSLEPNENI